MVKKIGYIINIIKSFYLISRLNKNEKIDIFFDDIIRLHKLNFKKIDLDSWILLLTHKYKSIFIEYENDKLIGYAFFIARSNDVAHLKNIAIKEEYLGKGNGSILLYKSFNKLSKCFKSVSLNVEVDNIIAIKLYEKLGFIEVSRNDNIIKMTKNIR